MLISLEEIGRIVFEWRKVSIIPQRLPQCVLNATLHRDSSHHIPHATGSVVRPQLLGIKYSLFPCQRCWRVLLVNLKENECKGSKNINNIHHNGNLRLQRSSFTRGCSIESQMHTYKTLFTNKYSHLTILCIVITASSSSISIYAFN